MPTLPDFLKKNSQKYKDNILFRQNTRYRTITWTYSDFYDFTLKTAELLNQKNISKGDKVIIVAPNSPEWTAIFGACSILGAVLVPLDILSNQAFIKKIIDKVNAKLIITSYSRPILDIGIKTIGIKNIFIEDIKDIINKSISKLPLISENDILEIVYTSGTTGEPKGVILTHNNIISNITAISTDHKSQRFVSVLPLSHMFEQTTGLLYPIKTGSSIVYPYSIKPTVIKKILKNEHITTIVCVPAFLESMYDSIIWSAKKEDRLKDMKRLLDMTRKTYPKASRRRILCRSIIKKIGPDITSIGIGGAPLDTKIENFFTTIGLELIKGYGLTETSPVISLTPFGKPKLGMVGKVLHNIDLKIADDNEILVKGPSVTKGYYNNPEADKEHFRKGWFKTGDLGELDNEGYLKIFDRKKDVIISSSGLNAYPIDIENVLNKINEVKEACVIGIKERGKENIHAILIPKKTLTQIEAENIMRKTNKLLLEHQKIMGITIWHKEIFPKTITRKIKKNIIKEELKRKKELLTKPESKPKKLAPKEKVISRPLYRILTEMTGIEDIHPGYKLYTDLKIDSLSRLDLISRLEEELDIELNETMINHDTTIKAFEGLLRKHREFKTKLPYTTWQYNPIIKFFGKIFRKLIVESIVSFFCRIESSGQENLEKIQQCIFVSNHQSAFDIPVISKTLPKKFQIAIPSSAKAVFRADDKKNFKLQLRKFIFSFFTRFMYGTYPLPREKGVRKSFEFSGQLVDRGLSLFIFPEGARTTTGKISQFKKGIGFLAKEMRLPLVPVKIKGLYEILPTHSIRPKKGTVKVTYGKPIFFTYKKSSVEITQQLKKEVEKL